MKTSKLLLMITAALAILVLAGCDKATKQAAPPVLTAAPSAKSQPVAVADTPATEPLPLIIPAELKLELTIQASSVSVCNTWDGDIKGTITTFSVGGKPVELETKKIVHDGGKAWIATKQYGKVRIAGAYGPYVKDSHLGCEVTNYIAPYTTTVSYVIPNVNNGACIWLTAAQLAELKKAL